MTGCGILRFREGLVTMRPQTVWTTDHIIMGQRYHIPTYVETQYFFRIVDFFLQILIDLTERKCGWTKYEMFFEYTEIKHYPDNCWLWIFLASRSTIMRRIVRDQLLIFIEYTKKRIPMRSSCIQMKTKNTVVFRDT